MLFIYSNLLNELVRWIDSMELIGFQIPLWLVFLGGLLIVVVAWKLIKFAIKLLVVLLIFFGLLIGLDMLGVFQYIQNLMITWF